MPFQDLLVGAGVGSVFGRLMVRRAEHRTGEEWPGMRVRQVEADWIAAGIAMSLVVRLLLS
jgi:hypothetical protein